MHLQSIKRQTTLSNGEFLEFPIFRPSANISTLKPKKIRPYLGRTSCRLSS